MFETKGRRRKFSKENLLNFEGTEGVMEVPTCNVILHNKKKVKGFIIEGEKKNFM